MGARLRSITRNPRLPLAYKGIAFSTLLWLYAAFPGWLSGMAFAAGAVLLYANPLFNASAFFPLFAAEMIISFALFPLALAFRAAVVIFLGCAFAITIGLKNLILTHRGEWARSVCYGLSYIALSIFFLERASGFFWLSWSIALCTIGLVWLVMIPDRHSIGPMLVVLGEMLWIVSWLPIGFFASANVVFLAMLFISGALAEKKITAKNGLLFAVLAGMVLASSYWKLQ